MPIKTKLGKYTLHEIPPNNHDLFRRDVFRYARTQTNVAVGDFVHHDQICIFDTSSPHTHTVNRIYSNLTDTIIYMELESITKPKKKDFVIVNLLEKNVY